jgi:serine/threonine-protein kinase HipA
MTRELVTFLDDRKIGILRQGKAGRLSFEYDGTWRNSRGAVPLSLSMPLVQKDHAHAVVNPFLWGLLPDNELILERWAARFHVSSRNAFSLLTHVGEDCAGAVRFVIPDREHILEAERGASIEWLTIKGVASRLRELRGDPSAWRRVGDNGQFSLAGARPKTALLFDGQRWGVPSGSIPTTHIVKPGVEGLEGHAANEHFCLGLARELGLPTVHSEVVKFEDEVAIVVERYDRIRRTEGIIRVHQEDVCQAMAVHPARKYEGDGGPGPRSIVDLLRANSRSPSEDLDTFVNSLAYAWLIAGTDAHAKNYSLLIGAEGRVRLAPLYDIASALPYHSVRARKLKLAMKIGGKYRVEDIGRYQFRKLAIELDLDAEEVLSRIHGMALRLPDLAAGLLRRMRGAGLEKNLLGHLADAIIARAKILGHAWATSRDAP